MTIFQGEIYWIDLGKPQGSEPAYLRPCVVVQNDVLIAWNNAKTLACETPEKQVITLDKIDRRTSALSRLIIAPNRWLGNHLQLLKLERESRMDIIEQLRKSGI